MDSLIFIMNMAYKEDWAKKKIMNDNTEYAMVIVRKARFFGTSAFSQFSTIITYRLLRKK